MTGRSPAALRPAVSWTLLGVLAMSAWALFWPADPTPQQVEAQDLRSAGPEYSVPNVVAPLPAELAKVDLESMVASNPFAPVQAVVTPAARPPPVVAPPIAAAPAAAVAPPVTQRFLGRMTDPEGTVSVYLAEGERPLRVSVGTRLDNGYRITSISDTVLNLQHETLNASAVIAVPPPVESSPR